MLEVNAHKEKLSKIDLNMLRKALKRLSSTKGVGLVFWHPIEMLLLPWEALQEICDILNEAENAMVWSQQTYLNKMVSSTSLGEAIVP